MVKKLAEDELIDLLKASSQTVGEESTLTIFSSRRRIYPYGITMHPDPPRGYVAHIALIPTLVSTNVGTDVGRRISGGQ